MSGTSSPAPRPPLSDAAVALMMAAYANEKRTVELDDTTEGPATDLWARGLADLKGRTLKLTAAGQWAASTRKAKA